MRPTGRSTTTPVALVIMAKYPAAGRVKTRLQPVLSPSQSADLQEVFLLHCATRLAELARQIGGELIVAIDPPDAVEATRRLLHVAGPVRVIPQEAGDLGNRLAAVAGRWRGGGEAVLFFGVDSPDLPPAHLRAAVEQLADADVALGPTSDGGYWCVGLRPGAVDADKLFDGVAWSSGHEFDQTAAAARRAGYRVGLAPAWHDVDRPADVEALRLRLRNSDDPEDTDDAADAADRRALAADLERIVPPSVADKTGEQT